MDYRMSRELKQELRSGIKIEKRKKTSPILREPREKRHRETDGGDTRCGKEKEL